MFLISFIDGPLEYPDDDPTLPAAPGKLQLGHWTEDFLANLFLWKKLEYESHWRNELRSLVAGAAKVALVVSYNAPGADSNMEIWRVYRDGEWARFQNQLLPYSALPRDFAMSRLNDCIADRRILNDDGQRISEWGVHLRDIETFLTSYGTA
jgi:hypothetical protein